MEEHLRNLPVYLGGHLTITLIALVAGLAFSLPLAILVARRPRARYVALTAAGIIQTVPSLALMALMVPLLDLSGIPDALGIPALGMVPAIIALTMYSTLPILRNTVTGLLEVDSGIVEAAHALGMTPRQVLWRVELPLAAPVIVAGIRTATVWTVGIATLATPVGQSCLGNYIFQGLQTRNWGAVIFGCVVAAVLAVILDGLVGLGESAARERKRIRGVVAAALLGVIFLAGLVLPSFRPGAEQLEGTRPVRIGSKDFSEQYILAHAITLTLEQAGQPVERKESLGSTVAFDALASGEIDAYVDYTGTLWATVLKREQVASAKEVLAVTAELKAKHGVVCLGRLGFENTYAVAMRRERAEELGLKTIEDLKARAPELSVGGDPEFFARAEWRKLRDTYGLNFRQQQEYNSTFMYEAVRSGDVDVIVAFSTDGRIAAYDLAVLTDTLHVFPPYDAVLLVSEETTRRPAVMQALKPLLGNISVDTMRSANAAVDLEKDSPRDAAAELLQGLAPIDASLATALRRLRAAGGRATGDQAAAIRAAIQAVEAARQR